ncbi:ubiquitin-conjugating enzyme E2 [Methyloterricola oryzae]|uniref:ubiquitin-conjugating enzyme E2 n=1 Tax=Methyloterricola oryzae TaxID=1495050 RepID=UPI0005EB2ADE|nr:ubiquitin-conjugating enzyme E2 [Methyloterricola oryzae]
MQNNSSYEEAAMVCHTNRREEELSRLRALEQRSGRRIRVMRMSGEPVACIDLKMEVWTAEDANFPRSALSEVHASLVLGALYPFVPPRVEVKTRVFNPLVDPQGRLHFGLDWSAGCHLDNLACRVFKILAFDEGALSLGTVVNDAAAEWYQTARSLLPSVFPSDGLAGVGPDAAHSFSAIGGGL